MPAPVLTSSIAVNARPAEAPRDDLEAGLRRWAVCFLPAMALIAIAHLQEPGGNTLLAFLAALWLIPISTVAFGISLLVRGRRWHASPKRVALAGLTGALVAAIVMIGILFVVDSNEYLRPSLGF